MLSQKDGSPGNRFVAAVFGRLTQGPELALKRKLIWWGRWSAFWGKADPLPAARDSRP
jgi:hypothetical protein